MPDFREVGGSTRRDFFDWAGRISSGLEGNSFDSERGLSACDFFEHGVEAMIGGEVEQPFKLALVMCEVLGNAGCRAGGGSELDARLLDFVMGVFTGRREEIGRILFGGATERSRLRSALGYLCNQVLFWEEYQRERGGLPRDGWQGWLGKKQDGVVDWIMKYPGVSKGMDRLGYWLLWNTWRCGDGGDNEMMEQLVASWSEFEMVHGLGAFIAGLLEGDGQWRKLVGVRMCLIGKELMCRVARDRWGWSGDEVMASWQLWRANHVDPELAVDLNVGAIEEIEGGVPGGARRLRDRFGLEVLAKYPARAMVDQLEGRYVGRPFVAVVGTTKDRRGGFYVRQTEYRRLYDQLVRRGGAMVFAEARRGTRVLQRVSKLCEYMGRPAEHVVVDDHGAYDLMQYERFSLTPEIVRRFLGNGWFDVDEVRRSCLAPGGRVILRSCGTGMTVLEDGVLVTPIGQVISEMLGVKVMAPDGISRSRLCVGTGKKRGEIRVYPDYSGPKMAVFVGGERVS